MHLAFTWQEIIYLFFIYSFLGWGSEVAFAAIKHGRYQNRGFLIGPICPIYGYGVVAVLLLLTPIKGNLFLLFVCSAIVTSLIEFFTGWFLEWRYNERWWDYSKNKFNIKGYVCLGFSILWGIAATVIVKFINPPITSLVDKFAYTRFGMIPGFFFLAVYIADNILSNKKVREYTKGVQAVEAMDAAIRKVSDSISLNIYENATESKEKVEDFMAREDVKEAVEEFSEKVETAKAHAEERAEKREEKRGEIVEAIEQRRDERNERREEIASALEKRRAEYNEEREKKIAELRSQLVLMQAERERVRLENEKHFKRIINKFPHIENGRHKAIFKRRDDSDNQFMN